jgi:LemA protein
MAIAILGVLVGAITWAIVSFNRFVAQRQVLENSWANVETELSRRHELIPALVETVRGYATHESDTLREVTEARTGAAGVSGGPEAHRSVENVLTAALRHLFAVSETYPELQASAAFLDLQHELITTEDRLQAARRLFNGNVREYNRRVESIPSILIAKVARFSKRSYFEAEPSVTEVPSARKTD